MKITITSTKVNEKPWEKNGRSGVIRTQEAVAENETFRNKVRLDLGKNDPFPVGEYTLDFDKNVTVGDFGDFKLSRNLELDPVTTATKARAA